MDDRTHSFGYWLRRRRKALDLTQEALAQRVSCSGFSIRKIEADERRPSRPLAERLAAALAVPDDERRDFLDAARALRLVDRLRLDAAPVRAATAVAAPAATGASAPSAPGPPVAAADASPFVGRSRELGLLVGLVERLGQGAGCTVLVEGEPGIGKSRLMHEVAFHAGARGIPVLASNCYEIERATPYQPVIELVTRALERVGDAALRALAPVSLAELAALVPEIGERVAGLPQLSNDFPEARRARLPRAVDQLLEAARGGAPALFVVDDIQWADDASAQVLQSIARHAARRPVLVIYACRDDEIATDERLARRVESLCRETDALRLPLARLGATETERLVAAFADPGPRTPGFAERLHRETEGHPFFLISILQSLREGEARLAPRPSGEPGWLPDALRAAVRVRLAHVPKACRPLLETAAVLGRRFDFDTLLAVSGEPEAQLLEAVEALVRRRLLHEEPEGGVFDFGHDKIREVVYRDLGGTRRRMLHRMVAEALERRGDGAAHERDARLAEHFERAQAWTQALHYLVLAGERSQALFALRDALHWLDRAVALAEAHPESLDEGRRLALYERRGAARAQAGQTRGAVTDMRLVVDAARAAGARERTRDALVRLGMAYRRADAYDDATACLAEALAESRALGDERNAADTLYHLGTVAWSSGRNDEAIRFHQQAVEICEREGYADLVAVQAYHGRGEAFFANAEPAAAIACYTRSLQLARGIGDRSYESENLMMIGHACVGAKGLGDYARAIAHFEAALEIARAADLQWHLGPTLLGLEHARACTGRYGPAWSAMQETLRWLESLGQVRYQLIAHDFLGQLLLDLDLNEAAARQLERGLAVGDATGILFWRPTFEAQLAIARSRLGRRADASALQALVDQTRRSAERYLTVRCLDAMAEIALAAGDAPRCRAHADELLAVAAPNGLREIEAGARRWRGEAWLMEGDLAAAQAELAPAAALARAGGRLRLQRDLDAALARLSAAQGRTEAAQCHRERADRSMRAIADSLVGSDLDGRLD